MVLHPPKWVSRIVSGTLGPTCERVLVPSTNRSHKLQFSFPLPGRQFRDRSFLTALFTYRVSDMVSQETDSSTQHGNINGIDEVDQSLVGINCEGHCQ